MNKEELIKITLEEIAKEKKIRRVDVISYDLANRLAEKLVNKTNDIHSVSQRYTIEDIERCVENWGLCKVEKEYIEKFLNGG